VKWFWNWSANQLLSWFSAFTPGVSKWVQQNQLKRYMWYKNERGDGEEMREEEKYMYMYEDQSVSLAKVLP